MALDDNQTKVNQVLSKLQRLDGHVIEPGSFADNRMRLSDKDREAWINYLADQYYKGEPVETPPEEFAIQKEEVMREIVKRRIGNMLGLE